MIRKALGRGQMCAPEQNPWLMLTQFLTPLVVADFDEQAASAYGKARSILEAQGSPTAFLDTPIAAHALSLDAVLVTNNAREFSRVPDLGLANWVTDRTPPVLAFRLDHVLALLDDRQQDKQRAE